MTTDDGHLAGGTMLIGRRFNGPPASGHGGWSAGLAAARVDRPAVTVTLRSPPPLETALDVRPVDGGVDVRAGDTLVMQARPDLPPDLDLPTPVDPDLAAEASRRFAWFEGHPFPTCFGCGPDRAPDDGLRLFSGPVGDGRFAVPWTPPGWTADPDDPARVAAGFVWAALDCPSAAPMHAEVSGAVVLGRITMALHAPVRVGRPHVIQSWPLRAEGRRRHTAVALLGPAGEPLATGRAVWFELG